MSQCVSLNVCPLPYAHPTHPQPAFSSAIWINPLFNSTADAARSAASVVDAFRSVGGTTVFLTMDSFSDFFDTFIAPSTDVRILISYVYY